MRPTEAAAAQRRADELIAPVNERLWGVGWSYRLEALADAGDLDGLAEHLALRDEAAASERTALIEASHARFHGRLLALRGDTAGAAEELESAARQFAAQRLPFHEAAARVELAETSGQPVSPEARATLERLDAVPWLARIDALERAVTV